MIRLSLSLISARRLPVAGGGNETPLPKILAFRLSCLGAFDAFIIGCSAPRRPPRVFGEIVVQPRHRRQYPLIGSHFFPTRLSAALLPLGIACKASKMCSEARHGEIHECADLRDGKPTLWGNEVHGHRGVLVLRQKDLQCGLRQLLSNVIGEKSGDAASLDGRGNGATNTIHREAW